MRDILPCCLLVLGVMLWGLYVMALADLTVENAPGVAPKASPCETCSVLTEAVAGYTAAMDEAEAALEQAEERGDEITADVWRARMWQLNGELCEKVGRIP